MPDPHGLEQHEDAHSLRPVRTYKVQGYPYRNVEGTAVPMVTLAVEALEPGTDPRAAHRPQRQTSLFEFMVSAEMIPQMIDDLQYADVEAKRLAEQGNQK